MEQQGQSALDFSCRCLVNLVGLSHRILEFPVLMNSNRWTMDAAPHGDHHVVGEGVHVVDVFRSHSFGGDSL